DIFRLKNHRAALIGEKGTKTVSADNLLAAIEARRTIGLDRFVYALGIRQVGQATARLLAINYGTLEALRSALTAAHNPESEAYADLVNIDQIGSSVAKDLTDFFAEAHNREVLDDLAGELTIEPFAAPVTAGSPVAGKTVVFTGTLVRVGRNEAKAKA